MDFSTINYIAVLTAALSTFIIGAFWYIFINGGYNVVAFTVMGAILGAWR